MIKRTMNQLLPSLINLWKPYAATIANKNVKKAKKYWVSKIKIEDKKIGKIKKLRLIAVFSVRRKITPKGKKSKPTP